MPRSMLMLLVGLALAAALAAAIGRARNTTQATDAATPGNAVTTSGPLANLSPADLREWLQQHPGAVVLDVRTQSEFAEGHLTGAVNIDVQAPDFATRMDSLDRGVPYVVYCRSGARSERAGNLMLQAGHSPVVNGGGFETLARAGFAAEGAR